MKKCPKGTKVNDREKWASYEPSQINWAARERVNELSQRPLVDHGPLDRGVVKIETSARLALVILILGLTALALTVGLI